MVRITVLGEQAARNRTGVAVFLRHPLYRLSYGFTVLPKYGPLGFGLFLPLHGLCGSRDASQ